MKMDRNRSSYAWKSECVWGIWCLRRDIYRFKLVSEINDSRNLLDFVIIQERDRNGILNINKL